MRIKLRVVLSICLILCLLSGCESQNNKEKIASERTISQQAEENRKVASSDNVEGSSDMQVNILENSKISLQVQKENETKIRGLMQKIATEGSISAAGHEVSLDDVRSFISVPQLRPISIDGPHGGLEFYSAHDSSSGGRLFIFYSAVTPHRLQNDVHFPFGREVDYKAMDCFFLKKSLFFKDFDGLNEGHSTLDDVEKIDPSARFNFFDPDERELANYYVQLMDVAGGGFYYYSVHVTKDGVVNIGYQKNGENFIVQKILKTSFEVIESVNEKDWP